MTYIPFTHIYLHELIDDDPQVPFALVIADLIFPDGTGISLEGDYDLPLPRWTVAFVMPASEDDRFDPRVHRKDHHREIYVDLPLHETPLLAFLHTLETAPVIYYSWME